MILQNSWIRWFWRAAPLVVTLVAASPAAADVQVGASVIVGGYHDVASVDVFSDELSPYGEWVEVRGHGRAWRPYASVVGIDFVPYASHGYWVDTEVGWVFESYWDWGWAPFHYGRWAHYDHFGWVWYPDVVWAPAWVEWRVGPVYVGWAPLGVGGVVTWGLGWTFVSKRDFVRHDFHHYCVSPRRVRVAYWATQPSRDTVRAHGRSWARGPAKGDIEHAAGYVVPRARVGRFSQRDERSRHERTSERRDGAREPSGPRERERNATGERDDTRGRGGMNEPVGAHGGRAGRDAVPPDFRPSRASAGRSRSNGSVRDADRGLPSRQFGGLDREGGSRSAGGGSIHLGQRGGEPPRVSRPSFSSRDVPSQRPTRTRSDTGGFERFSTLGGAGTVRVSPRARSSNGRAVSSQRPTRTRSDGGGFARFGTLGDSGGTRVTPRTRSSASYARPTRSVPRQAQGSAGRGSVRTSTPSRATGTPRGRSSSSGGSSRKGKGKKTRSRGNK